VLSDSGYRSYIAALMYSVANRTDGAIEKSDLPHIPNFDSADIPELVGGDLLEPRADAWLIADYSATQSSRSLLESYEHRKAWDRDRKAKQASARHTAQRNSGGVSGGNLPVDSLQPTNQPTNPKAPKVPRSNATERNGAHIKDL